MIKSILFFFIFLSFQINVSAQISPTVNVDVVKNVIIINNITFTKNSSIADYEKVLGKAERIEKVAGKDKIFAYDKLGISFSLKMNTDIVQDVYITYLYDGDKKVAKEEYKGKLSINDKEISNKTTADEISKLSKIDLVMSMKGLYIGKGKSLLLMVYYPETTIGQFGVSFQN
jgi:hypothetical protein